MQRTVQIQHVQLDEFGHMQTPVISSPQSRNFHLDAYKIFSFYLWNQSQAKCM